MTMKRFVLPIILSGLITEAMAGMFSFFDSTHDKADKAYDSKNYVVAASLYRKSCDDGDFQGCNDIGYMYENGLGVSKNIKTAREYYVKACEGGWGGACYNIKLLGREDVFQECDNGNQSSCKAALKLYLDPTSIKRNFLKAENILSKYCNEGDLDACAYAGDLNSKGGDGLNINYFKSFELFKKACDGGLAIACINVGKLYQNGQGTRLDLEKAAEYFGKACDAKYDEGCKRYSQLKTPPSFQQTKNDTSSADYQRQQLEIQRQQLAEQKRQYEEQKLSNTLNQFSQDMDNLNQRQIQYNQQYQLNRQLKQINNNLNGIRYGY